MRIEREQLHFLYGCAFGNACRAGAFCVAFLFSFFLGSRIASAQTTTRGAISGVVTDASGGVVVGADVTAVEANTETTYKVKTGSSGDYRFSDLLVGTYDVTVDAPGFKTSTSHGIIVELSSIRNVDVVLQPGSGNERVTVNIDAVNLETQTSDVGTVITTQQVLDLPLALGGVGATRSPEGFVFLVPWNDRTRHQQWRRRRV